MVQLIAARYELVEVLGRGGMGAVWRARDRTLGREVAVKEVSLPQGLDDAQVERTYARTFREARSAARLDHPGIVTVHDVVEEGGRPWIVMQLVRAESLDKLIAREGPLPPARVAAIGADLLDALRAAHAAGVVHRDVKPGNVLLPPGRAVLTDFGIATVAGDETLTQAGAIVGSPAYLAPEQARHQKATPASDLWSLGATLYAAVEGRPPYRRPDVWGVMAAVLSDDPDPLRLAGPLTPVLHGLLHKDPERRMSPDDAGRLLRQVAMDASVAAPHNLTLPPPVAPPTVPSAFPPPPPPATSRRVPWQLIVPGGVFTVALVAAVVAVVMFINSGDDDGEGAGTTTSPPVSASQSQDGNVPPGYRQYQGSAFVAAIPKDWKDERDGDDVTFRSPTDGGLAIQRIASTTFADPGNGLADALSKMKDDTDQYPGFTQVRFDRNVPYQGDLAAEAEFTFAKDGVARRVRIRVFKFDSAIYQVLLGTSQDHWDASVPVYTTFLATLRGTG
ncbi:hypothetical protein GCM10022254_66250 [Actinomadura meridiana]|uniref:non-specific serine/threonine protein kinase n=1 Tax=Actinomadura meridiana TaxID=559626 RepID=A0ABP8CL30_9ACTN